MREDGVAKTVFGEWIQQAVVLGLIYCPVLTELLRAKNQYFVVFQLEVFDNCECLEGFTQTYAICEDAAVVFENLVDRSLDPISLKLKKSLPDTCINNLNVLIQ